MGGWFRNASHLDSHKCQEDYYFLKKVYENNVHRHGTPAAHRMLSSMDLLMHTNRLVPPLVAARDVVDTVVRRLAWLTQWDLLAHPHIPTSPRSAEQLIMELPQSASALALHRALNEAAPSTIAETRLSLESARARLHEAELSFGAARQRLVKSLAARGGKTRNMWLRVAEFLDERDFCALAAQLIDQ